MASSTAEPILPVGFDFTSPNPTIDTNADADKLLSRGLLEMSSSPPEGCPK